MATKEVNRLQVRIAKATVKNDINKVKRLQYLLTHSFYAKALAVKKVTSNKGKNTSGVDKQPWSTSTAKMKVTLSLTSRQYKAKPLRRVYIEKKNKRPLGIPTMYDIAMQTLHAFALEPVAEVKGDQVSFGFQKGISAKDACEQIFCVLARKCSPQWILEGDIKGYSDNISHEWLMENVPMDKRIMKQFLKSGFIYKNDLFPTETGSPQGGSISSLYANMTLDGLEKLIQDYYREKAKVNLIRYTDDLIITASTKEIAEGLKTLIRTFLKECGLELSEKKVIIVHINDGFDFLGWTFRRHPHKLIIRPSKDSVKALIRKVSTIILKEGKAQKQEDLIRRLNSILIGWTNYHKPTVASRTFSYVNNTFYLLLEQ